MSDGEGRRARLRSFVLGGGAARASAGGRPTPAGLTAFEEAPCFQETLEQEESVPRERR